MWRSGESNNQRSALGIFYPYEFLRKTHLEFMIPASMALALLLESGLGVGLKVEVDLGLGLRSGNAWGPV